VLPTGKELVDQYLMPLSKLPVLKESIQYNSKVISISRKQNDKMKSLDREKKPFEIYVEKNNDIEIVEARAVIDATGTWRSEERRVGKERKVRGSKAPEKK